MPAYPICPWKHVPEGLLFDKGTVGTAFFVSEKGIFITAAHVVREYLEHDTPLRIMFVGFDPPKLYPVQPDHIVCHPTLDVAIGIVPVPTAIDLKRFVLADVEVPAGEAIGMYGFSHTEVLEIPPVAGDKPGLGLKFWPAFHQGHIDSYRTDGFGLARGPVYVHTAETLGAASGGPVVHFASSMVCGVTSSGSEEYGTATDVRAILEWPFLDGMTLRALADAGLVSIRALGAPSATAGGRS